jgi:hypothetical protein
MGRVLAASAGLLVVLYSSSIPLFILYSSSIHPLLSSIHPRFILDSSSIQPRSLSLPLSHVFDFLVPSSTRLSIMHFRHAPLHPSVQILYPSFLHPRSYSSCLSVDPLFQLSSLFTLYSLLILILYSDLFIFCWYLDRLWCDWLW